MVAAVYGRKSSDNEAGVARQVELARDFIIGQGWTLDPAHVYTDNDVSGSVFTRPGLDALMLAVLSEPRAFGMLVMMDASRLGRDMAETLAFQLRIIGTGCRVFHYQDGQELLLNTPVQKLVASVANFSHEDFRYQIRLKTRAALTKKAEQGHVAGNKVYGFDNLRIGTGPGSHSERAINRDEAQIIERIFMLAAQGWGYRRIAQDLNTARVPHPRAGHVCKETCKHLRVGQPFREWGSTTVKAILANGIYKGVIRYGGKRLDLIGPRIVTDEQWDAAHTRLAKTRATWTGYRKGSGQIHGRPEAGLIARHAFSGLLRCGGCGGSMTLLVRAKKTTTLRYWACSALYKRGHVTCPARALVPADRLEKEILGHFDREHLERLVISEEFNEPIQAWALAYGQSHEQAEAEVTRTQAEVDNLLAAIRLGGDIPALVAALRVAQQGHHGALARLDALGRDDWDGDPAPDEMAQLEAELRDLETGLEPLTVENASPEAKRRVLRQILPAPVTVTPVRDSAGQLEGWDYSASVDLSGFLGADHGLLKSTASVGRWWITRWVSPGASRDFAH